MQTINFICLLSALRISIAARITGLDVPNVAIVGDKIRLRCDYDESDGSRLYSLKWYKDGEEFFRYLPGNKQTITQRCSESPHPSPYGISIDCWVSSEKEVVLKDLTVKTSGEFKCEVIGDHPAFRREQRVTKLRVYREPLQIPVIAGNVQYYEIGDTVSLNCTSQNREYVPALTWFINGKPAQEYDMLRPQGIDQSSLGLFFTATPLKFSHGRMEVSCRATMGPNHSKSTQEVLSIPGLLRPQYYSSGHTFKKSYGLFIYLVIILKITN